MRKPRLKDQCKLLCLTHQRQCVAEEHHANACLCANAVHTPEIQRRKTEKKGEMPLISWHKSNFDHPSWCPPFNNNMDIIDAALGSLAGASVTVEKEELLLLVKKALNTGAMDAIDAALGPLAGASVTAEKEELLLLVKKAFDILKNALYEKGTI